MWTLTKFCTSCLIGLAVGFLLAALIFWKGPGDGNPGSFNSLNSEEIDMYMEFGRRLGDVTSHLREMEVILEAHPEILEICQILEQRQEIYKESILYLKQ